MNVLLVLLLAALAFFFVNEGLIFLAFITLVLLVLAALGGSNPRPEPAFASAAGGREGPDVILEQEEPDIPSNIDIKVKPNWEANTLFEDMFAADGEMIDVVGRSLARFATGGKYGKPRKAATDEPEFSG